MSLRDKAAGSAKTWSGKVRDLADQGTAVAKNRAESMTSSIGRGIAARSGEDNAYGRVATVLDLSDEQATVRLESFVTAFISAVRQVDAEDLSSDDVINAAVRRQRWIGLASMPAWSVGMYASSLYCEAAILCHVEQLHQLGLTNEQLAAHLLALWKVMPDYEQAEAAIQGTGPSVAAFHKARTQTPHPASVSTSVARSASSMHSSSSGDSERLQARRWTPHRARRNCDTLCCRRAG